MSGEADLPRAASLELAGWGNAPSERCEVYRPERLEELRAVVRAAPEGSLVPRGLGRSYGDASLNRAQGVVLTSRFDRLLAFDPATGVLHCQAAVSLADVIDVFLPRGFFLPVTPGTKHITIGGAIAADVHGKNHHRDGSTANFVRDLRLLTADGEIRSCSREENADLFWATIGGMGLTGLILDARIQLRTVASPWLLVDTLRGRDIDAVLEAGEDDDDYAYCVSWIDVVNRGRGLGRGVVMRANPAGRDDLPARLRDRVAEPVRPSPLQVPFRLPEIALNPLTMSLFNHGYHALHRPGRRLSSYDRYFYMLDQVGHWNRIYGRRGVLQFQLSLPPEESRAGLVEILEALPRPSGASFLVVLKSFGAASDGMLSFPSPGQTLALDFPNRGERLLPLLRDLERRVLARGGRIYLAKDTHLSPEGFRAMYPRAAEFLEVKRKVDPQQRFSSSLARRLELVA